MSHPLISHNPDLKRLQDEGIEIEIQGGYLVVHHIPYLRSATEVRYGILVSTLALAGERVQKPDTHVAYFIGEVPCDKSGNPIHAIINASARTQLAEKIVIDHTLSAKPQNGYADYFEKITTYINIISAPAKSIDPSVTEKTFRVLNFDDTDRVFNYPDTNSARSQIDVVTAKLKTQKVAIIGLGGTGSYILDLVAKTPVAEIHLYDGDVFVQHNAFRAPGAPSSEQLEEVKKKVDYFKAIYSNMHLKIVPHGSHITASLFGELDSMTMVFMCFDEGETKKGLANYLEEKGIRFIDVGMGLQKVEDTLIGIVRVTSSTERKRDHVLGKERIPFTDGGDNEYSNNIQIADLNALNAALAVIKWKKLCGFYQDLERENYSVYSINVSQLLNEDNDP